MLKAYEVGDSWDNDARIIFSEDEEAGIPCPQYDEYWIQQHVPLTRLIEDGWRWECEQCYTVVDNDYWDYEEDVELVGSLITKNYVLCSTNCVEEYNKETRICQQIKGVVHSRWPRVTVKFVNPKTLTCYLYFGGKGSAYWECKNPDSVLINLVDKETWEKFNS
jgi:hypothetical protein